MAYEKVVVVGGGFGGLTLVKCLKKAKLNILLIDKTNHHLFQPLLYEVATASISPGEIATPLREIVRTSDHIAVLMGEVVDVNKEKKEIILANGDTLSYDYLVLAPGSRHSYFGNDHWETFAPGLKTINDAVNIRERILVSFEKAERMDSFSEAEKYLNFIIIGGGPTGVEMAGAIAEIAHQTMLKNFRKIQPEKTRITLIEAFDRILPPYPEKLSRRAQSDLEELGVTVLTGKKVINVTAEGVYIEGGFYPSNNVFWAAGNQASPLLKTLGIPLDRAGRAIVEKDLSIPGYPEIFVIGDSASFINKEGKPLPGIAPTAIQMGKHVAKMLSTARRSPFHYHDKGFMATIGKLRAVAVLGKIHLSGFVAWFAWVFIHIIYLIGFRNRFAVLMEWFYCLLTGQRGVRLLYHTIDKQLPKKNQ